MPKLFRRKQAGPVSLVPAAVWYFLTNRVAPFVAKNAVALLTFLYFFYILGTSGGVDIRHMTDEQAVLRCAAGFIIWLGSITSVQMVKELYRRKRQ